MSRPQPLPHTLLLRLLAPSGAPQKEACLLASLDDDAALQGPGS